MSLARGFSLIEALVALLVLSIAALGLGAMQLKGLQSAHVSYQRAIAVIAAEDAEERLWAWMSNHPEETCPDDAALDTVERAWVTDWQLVGALAGDNARIGLPGFERSQLIADTSSDRCRIDILTAWRDERFRDSDGEVEDVSTLRRAVVLPALGGGGTQ